jgi:long-chain acyl-CoA synthetase
MPQPKFGKTLAEVYRLAAEEFGDWPAFSRKDASGVFQSTGFRELYEKGLNLASALIALGVRARDHVAILSDNRLEWIIADYGILLAGAADYIFASKRAQIMATIGLWL